MIVVGLDMSLTCTGVAVVQTAPEGASIHLERVRSTGKATDTLQQRQGRLGRLAARVAALVEMPDLVVIEAPAYGAQNGHQHDRSGLWWLVVYFLMNRGVRVLEVPPTVVKRYATGKGNASKDVVLAAVVRRFLETDVSDNNLADALTLAAVGARALGEPIDGVISQACMDGMKTVDLPE